MIVGRIAADVATTVAGAAGFTEGIAIATGGAVAGCAATLCVASPVAVVAGAGVAAVGASVAVAGAVGIGENLALLSGNGSEGLGNQPERRYVPSPKHSPQGGWGSPMDLDNETAQQVLDNGIGSGNQVYGYDNGNVYVFQPDNAGGYHGYNVTGSKNIPTQVLRKWRKDGIITNAEYKQMLKWADKK